VIIWWVSVQRLPAGAGGRRQTGTLDPCPTAVTTTVGRSRATKPVAYQPVRLSEVSRGGPPPPAGSITTIAATRGCLTYDVTTGTAETYPKVS